MDRYKRILILRLVLAVFGVILALESLVLKLNIRLGIPSFSSVQVSTYNWYDNNNPDQDYSSDQSSYDYSSDTGNSWDSGDSGWDSGGSGWSDNNGWDSGGDSGSWDSGGGDSGSW
jgi:hypothetical protein